MSLLLHREIDERSILVHSVLGKAVILNLHQVLKPHPSLVLIFVCMHFSAAIKCIPACIGMFLLLVVSSKW